MRPKKITFESLEGQYADFCRDVMFVRETVAWFDRRGIADGNE